MSMLAATPDPKISLIGILVELGACLLLTTLVLGLRRETARRQYFIHWSWAWVALSLAFRDPTANAFSEAPAARQRQRTPAALKKAAAAPDALRRARVVRTTGSARPTGAPL